MGTNTLHPDVEYCEQATKALHAANDTGADGSNPQEAGTNGLPHLFPLCRSPLIRPSRLSFRPPKRASPSSKVVSSPGPQSPAAIRSSAMGKLSDQGMCVVKVYARVVLQEVVSRVMSMAPRRKGG